LTESELNWVAGIFEGEGCISMLGRGAHLSLTVAMADEDVVRRVARLVGVGTVLERSRQVEHWKTLWVWRCGGFEAAQLLRVLLPHLGARRSARAREALAVREVWIAEVTKERRCESCGRSYTPAYRSGGRRRRFCSKRCLNDWWNPRRPCAVVSGQMRLL
jgi:hypothetical protein